MSGKTRNGGAHGVPRYIKPILTSASRSLASLSRWRHALPRLTPVVANTPVRHTKYNKLLIFTTCNRPYHVFGALYPLFAATSNPEARIEIAVERWNVFEKQFGKFIEFYGKYFGDRVTFSSLSKSRISPNSTRFLVQPHTVADYVYIVDIDVLLMEDVLQPHLDNIAKHRLNYSNIKRVGENKLSGLHFIKYDNMYPVKIPRCTSLRTKNDEELLFDMMLCKGYNIPDESIDFRPVHGLHMSLSRPPLPTLTAEFNPDNKVFTDIYSWFSLTKDGVDLKPCKQYLQFRTDNHLGSLFMKLIRPQDNEMRKIIQYADLVCNYVVNYLDHQRLPVHAGQ